METCTNSVQWFLNTFDLQATLLLLLLLSRSSHIQLSQPHRWQPTRLPRPWDSPGKNTGVGCHFLLQCMKVKVKVKSQNRVQLLVTPWTAAYQGPPSMEFSRQEYWSGVPLPSLTGYSSRSLKTICIFASRQLACHYHYLQINTHSEFLLIFKILILHLRRHR